jgi:hypothetical protein
MNDGDIESHLILTSNSQEWVLFNTDKKVKDTPSMKGICSVLVSLCIFIFLCLLVKSLEQS